MEPQHDIAVQVNAESTGMLMQHCRRAESFVFVSASAVYERQEPEHLYAETDPLGGKASSPEFVESEVTLDSFASDNTRREKLVGPCKVGWRDGVRNTVERRFSDAFTAG